MKTLGLFLLGAIFLAVGAIIRDLRDCFTQP